MNPSTFPILLVEDDSNDAILLQRSLRRANVASPMQVVTDGEEAIAYLSGREPYHDRSKYPFPFLMLLDLKLPRKSGLEVLAWVRKQPDEVGRLPVIVLTSSRQSDDIDQAYALGADSYLAKPHGNFDGLIEMVKRQL